MSQVSFNECGSAVTAFAATVLRTHHPDLADAGVEIQYGFAFCDDDWPLKIRGQRVLARVKIVNLEDRALGGPDAKITIDKGWWDDHDEAERAALLDHEQTHLLLKKPRRTEKGELRFDVDNCGRPKLTMKRHDLEMGIFFEVITRHQQKAVDFQVVVKAVGEVKKWVQREFDWGTA